MFGATYRDPRSPLLAELSPNTTPPTEARIFQALYRQRSVSRLLIMIGGPGGTDATVTTWVLDPTAPIGSQWFRLAGPTKVNAGETTAVVGIPPEASLFIQVSAVTGAPTYLGAVCLGV